MVEVRVEAVPSAENTTMKIGVTRDATVTSSVRDTFATVEMDYGTRTLPRQRHHVVERNSARRRLEQSEYSVKW